MLSILIVNWNTRDLLERCLATIRAQSGPIWEAIVVDNASRDGSAEMVREQFPEVELLAETRNWGYAEGNNLAYRRAQYDLILTLNADTELPPGVLSHACAVMAENAQVGALSCRFRGLDGESQASVRGFPTLLGLAGDALGLARIWPGSAFDSYRLNSFDYDRRQPAPQPMATFLLFRRQAIEAVNPPGVLFDPAFPIFFNEVDLLKRMSDAGWSCLYTPEIEIRHLGGMSTKQVRRDMIWESHRSLIRYLKRHVLRGWRRLLQPGVVAAIWIAAWVRARGFSAGFRP